MLRHLVSVRRSFRNVIALALVAIGIGMAQAPPIAENTIIDHLNGAISWYRELAAIDQNSGQPSDVLYLANARGEGKQVLQLAFQSAESIAALQDAQPEHGNQAPAGEVDHQASGDQRTLANALQSATDRLKQDQAQIAQLDKEIGRARGAKRQELISRRDSMQGVIPLDKALQDQLQKISGFVSNSERAQGGLTGKIGALKQSVPEVFAAGTNETAAKSATNTQSTSTQNANASRAQASGLVGQAAYVLAQTREIHKVDRLISQTDRLRASATALQTPLRDSLKSFIRRGRNAASQASTADQTQIDTTQKNLQELTTQFKQVADAALPLRQEIVLLDAVHGNLEQWRDSMLREYGLVLRSLLTRVGAILFALGLIVALSALWRRATLRYVHDARRRRQILLIRRFVTSFLMGIIILLGFVSEFSSLATFAGFITAGIAVALQTVILSVAAYFTLIGRRGVRIGDRVTIAGVTGDVLEVGLVRIYLLELGGTGIDLYPTGRVVVFSNSVLFGTTPLYRQLPGTSFTWHELAMTMSPEVDPGAAQLMLTNAANSVYDSYRGQIDHQHAVLERMLDRDFTRPQPSASWQFSDVGLELVLRYPVPLERAGETDDQMTRQVMRVIATNPHLKSSMSGTPKLRAAIKA